MGYDLKYGQVTTEHGDIPADEPVVVFRARDMWLPTLLLTYGQLCASGHSPQRHQEMIADSMNNVLDWQRENADRVRVPDSESSRAWRE